MKTTYYIFTDADCTLFAWEGVNGASGLAVNFLNAKTFASKNKAVAWLAWRPPYKTKMYLRTVKAEVTIKEKA